MPLLHLRGLVVPLLIFSMFTNLAVLVSPLFMMQVLDRVVPSGNLNTLIMLLLLAVAVLAVNALIEHFRDTALFRSAIWFEHRGTEIALNSNSPAKLERVLDVRLVAKFLSFGGAVTALNVPWIALFMAALYLLHPAFLALAFFVSVVIIGVRFLGSYLSQESKIAAHQAKRIGNALVADLQNHQRLTGMMSIGRNIVRRHKIIQADYVLADNETRGTQSATSSFAGFVRSSAQIGSLATGAALVTQSQLSAGGMIGASIIMAKTIGAVEGLVKGATNFRETFDSYKRLSVFDPINSQLSTDITDLTGNLKVENLVFPRGLGAPPRLDRISFELDPGDCLAVLGESGSGKSTLLHALCGSDPAPIGAVRMDQTDIRTLAQSTRDTTIGYLPQQANLMPGSIAENISCFALQRNDDQVVDAARQAGVHSLISSLPNAYESNLQAEPHLLSAGQIQRVALARAIYNQPKYLFLDEPNALLDSIGERRLCDALARLKKQGCTIVMVIHRAGVMGLADKVLILDRGRMSDFGRRSEVLGRATNGHRQIRLQFNTAALQDLTDWVARQFNRSTDDELQSRTMMVATELYNFARVNGPNTAARQLTFDFSFEDESNCILKLSEPRRTKLTKKISKVSRHVDDPSANFEALKNDELALAMVLQLAADFNLKTGPKSSEYVVKLAAAQASRAVAVH